MQTFQFQAVLLTANLELYGSSRQVSCLTSDLEKLSSLTSSSVY